MRKKKSDVPPSPTADDLKKEVNKKWGEQTMLYASDDSLNITRIPSGILTIDILLGGGFARGRHTEIFGGFSVGKTLTTLRLLANAQQMGLSCAYIDLEGSFDPEFAAHQGIDLDSLMYHRQEHGNRVIDYMEVLLRSEMLDVIVMDSIAALLPKNELETSIEAGSFGTQQAKLMSAALRRLTTANKNTALVYINQIRDNIGSVFIKQSITSGGRAMGFYAGTRIEMSRSESIKKKKKMVNPSTGEVTTKDVISGHRVDVRLAKDKTGNQPFSSTSFVYDYDTQDIDHAEELIYLGRTYELIEKVGNKYILDGVDYSTQSKFKKFLQENEEASYKLEGEIFTAALGE